MRPGFYPASQLSNAEYHASAGVSCSGLKTLLISPYHYWANYKSGLKPPEDFSKPRFIGTAIHAATLEPERFGAEYVIAPFDRRNEAGFKAWCQAEKEDQNRIVLVRPEASDVAGMRRALQNHPTIGPMLTGAVEFEYSVYATDPVTGVLVRIRLDMLAEGGWIFDLKKTQDASQRGAAKAISNYDYFMQAAFYLDVMTWAAGDQPPGMAFGFVEEKFPWAAACYCITDEDLERGRRMYRALLNQYADCLERDYWPSYQTDGAEFVELGHWKRRQLDETYGVSYE